MSASVEQRLEAWRAVLRKGGPAWLVEFAPEAIRELETELARRGQREAICPNPGLTEKGE